MNTRKQKVWIVVGIVIIAFAVSLTTYLLSRHAEIYSTTSVTTRDLEAVVRASGTVVPDQTSSLSFSSQGKIEQVNVVVGDVVHKGDVLASLDTGTVQAQLDGAHADLLASQAQLSKLEEGTRPEALAIYNQNYNDASSALLVAMNNAYLQTTDAISNKTDVFFTNGASANPTINILTQNQAQQLSIDQERILLNSTITNWKTVLSNTTSGTSSIESAITETQNDLLLAQTFLNDLSAIANNLSTSNSALPQSTINTYTTIINGAQQEVTAAANTFTTANTAWSSAQNNLALQNAGSQSQDIQAQTAVVAKAQAEVEGYQSALSQSYIIAPFDGTITAVNVKVGEVFVPGISADEGIDIISTDLYDIDVYVPENALSGLAIGNSASVTFDAYGSDVIFPATVFLIDPAETVINGVNSYKVTLHFTQPDARIRSGLTVNTVITTATATDALAVPSRTLITQGTDTFVLLKQSDGNFIQQAVTTGITSSDGYTQILSGLNQGDTIADFGTGTDY